MGVHRSSPYLNINNRSVVPFIALGKYILLPGVMCAHLHFRCLSISKSLLGFAKVIVMRIDLNDLSIIKYFYLSNPSAVSIMISGQIFQCVKRNFTIIT